MLPFNLIGIITACLSIIISVRLLTLSRNWMPSLYTEQIQIKAAKIVYIGKDMKTKMYNSSHSIKVGG